MSVAYPPVLDRLDRGVGDAGDLHDVDRPVPGSRDIRLQIEDIEAGLGQYRGHLGNDTGPIRAADGDLYEHVAAGLRDHVLPVGLWRRGHR